MNFHRAFAKTRPDRSATVPSMVPVLAAVAQTDRRQKPTPQNKIAYRKKVPDRSLSSPQCMEWKKKAPEADLAAP
jgi:hypothetical protein